MSSSAQQNWISRQLLFSEVETCTFLVMHRNFQRQKFSRNPIFLTSQTCLGTSQGMFQKYKTKGCLNMNWIYGVPNDEYGWMSLNVTSKFNIPWIILNWIAFTWSSRWGQVIWIAFLDWRGLLWPGTASWPLHKNHSDYTEVLKILKLWHGFKIFPILADLRHMSPWSAWPANQTNVPWSQPQ